GEGVDRRPSDATIASTRRMTVTIARTGTSFFGGESPECSGAAGCDRRRSATDLGVAAGKASIRRGSADGVDACFWTAARLDAAGEAPRFSGSTVGLGG